jgi:hypothetical protein
MPRTAKIRTPAKRGIKKGRPNPGAFKKGYDPRRLNTSSPRAAWRDELSEKLKGHVPAAVKFLAASVANEELATNIRMEAATQILDRRYGKPVTRDVQLVIGSPKEAEATVIEGDVNTLTNEQLNQIAASALHTIEQERLDAPIEGVVIEGEGVVIEKATKSP